MNRLLRLLLGAYVASVSIYGVAGDLVPPIPSFPALASASSGVVEPVVLHALPRVKGGAFDLRFVNVGQVIDLVYEEALHVPHVIASDVLEDSRVVSFQFDGETGDLKAFMHSFLDSLGFQVDTRNGVEFVSKKTPGDSVKVDRQTLVYQPRYRSAAYLDSLIEPLFSARARSSPPVPAASGAGASAPDGGAVGVSSSPRSAGSASSAVTGADQVLFVGNAHEVEQVRAMLPQLDVAPGEVVVRGWAYEVDDTGDSNTGFLVASKLLGVGLSVSSGSTGSDPNALQFTAGRLDFAISAMNNDSRFKEVSSPNVRVVSGQQVKLNVGQQVPTVSSISFQGTSGTPVQSIEYQDAGVIFNVTPTVMADAIEVNIDEEISSFVSTTTGVNSSPTKNTRSLQTVADMKDGEVIVLGGLIQDQDTVSNSHERFLPAFLDGHTKSKDRTEVVLVLQVQKI